MAKPVPDLPASTKTAEALNRALQGDPLQFPDLESMARFCDWSVKKLEAGTRQHFHRGALDLLQRRHLEHAAAYLLFSDSPIDDAAQQHAPALGGHFEDLFLSRFFLTPEQYRSLGTRQDVSLDLPTWFHRERVLAYLGRDPSSLTERVDGFRFTFATRLGSRAFTVEVELGERSARYTLHDAVDLSPAESAVLHDRVLRYLALVINPQSFESRDGFADLSRLIGNLHGLSIPQTPTIFDGFIWVVAGQQVSLAVAFSLRRRLTEAYGDECGGGLRVPPTAETVAGLSAEDLRALSFSRAKADYILGLSRAVAEGALDLDHLVTSSALRIERELASQRGLGPWSVQYLMMRSFGLADCVPVGDAALARNLVRFFDLPARPNARRTLELMAPFAPYRSLASFHFWSLESRAQ